jgi:hypothetical protein
MDPLISLLIMVVIFAIAAYGLWWICKSFELPAPVLWICGAILIIILLGFLLQHTGLYHFHG